LLFYISQGKTAIHWCGGKCNIHIYSLQGQTSNSTNKQINRQRTQKINYVDR